ncbi:MAG: hypothetical protein RDV41_03260 [Planctomycetota bacterium]|nr:hypothetical protein [Planctomycetota bacterium]
MQAKDQKNEALRAATDKMDSTLDEAQRAFDRGDVAAALGHCEKLKTSKILKILPDVEAAVAVIEMKAASLVEKKKREEADKAARVGKYQKLMTDARSVETESRLDEAILLYRKALAVAATPEEITTAKTEQRRLTLTFSEQYEDLKSNLQAVRNYCKNRMPDKALERCRSLVGDPKHAVFAGELAKALTEVEATRDGKAAAETTVANIDSFVKRLEMWVDEHSRAPTDLMCPDCVGTGFATCVACKGSGTTEDQKCPDCAQVPGQVVCKKCIDGFLRCSRCKGHGNLQEVIWETVRCPLCGGSGYFSGLSCSRCSGTGAVRQGKRGALVECVVCKGARKSKKDCPDCEKGFTKCTRCDSKGVLGKVCAQCAGSGRVECAKCHTGGIDPAKLK